MSADAPGTSSADPAACAPTPGSPDGWTTSSSASPAARCAPPSPTTAPTAPTPPAPPDLDRLLDDLALRCLQPSDTVDQVAADFEAAGQGPDLRDLLLPQVAADTGALLARPRDTRPEDAGPLVTQPASLPVDLPATPPAPSPESTGVAEDFLDAARDEVVGTVEGLVGAVLHPVDAAEGILGMVAHPGDTLRELVDWDDLESGYLARWLGHMAPVALLSAVGGAGLIARFLRLVGRFSAETAALRATARALARELGARDARLLATQLGRVRMDELLRWMPPSELRRFVLDFTVSSCDPDHRNETLRFHLVYNGYTQDPARIKLGPKKAHPPSADFSVQRSV